LGLVTRENEAEEELFEVLVIFSLDHRCFHFVKLTLSEYIIDEVIEHYKNADYVAEKIYDRDPEIAKLVDFIISKELFAVGNKKSLIRLYMEIVTKDWFMTLLDIKDYIRVKEQLFEDYEDRNAWAKKMLVNISKAGFFSSDRTIEQYNEDIWKLK